MKPTREQFARGGVWTGPRHIGPGARPGYVIEPFIDPEQVARVRIEMERLRCLHIGAVPVDSIVTGETLAWWCCGCETQLPADQRAWAGPDGQPIYTPHLRGDAWPTTDQQRSSTAMEESARATSTATSSATAA